MREEPHFLDDVKEQIKQAGAVRSNVYPTVEGAGFARDAEESAHALNNRWTVDRYLEWDFLEADSSDLWKTSRDR